MCNFDNGHVEFDGDQLVVLERARHMHEDRLWEGDSAEYVRGLNLLRASGGEETQQNEWSEFGVEADRGRLDVGYL